MTITYAVRRQLYYDATFLQTIDLRNILAHDCIIIASAQTGLDVSFQTSGIKRRFEIICRKGAGGIRDIMCRCAATDVSKLNPWRPRALADKKPEIKKNLITEFCNRPPVIEILDQNMGFCRHRQLGNNFKQRRDL